MISVNGDKKKISQKASFCITSQLRTVQHSHCSALCSVHAKQWDHTGLHCSCTECLKNNGGVLEKHHASESSHIQVLHFVLAEIHTFSFIYWSPSWTYSKCQGVGNPLQNTLSKCFLVCCCFFFLFRKARERWLTLEYHFHNRVPFTKLTFSFASC